MAYIGTPVQQALTKVTSQSFNGTGSQTVFTLNRAVNTGEELEVFVNNVQQEPGVGKSYSATGTTLTFDAAPSSGTGNIYVIYRGSAEVTRRLEHDPNAALAATTGTFSGNVGIETTSANKSLSSTALTVNTATAGNFSSLELSSGDTLNWHINSNNAAVYDVTAGTRPRIFYTNGTERMRIDSSGNLLVGTTSTSLVSTSTETGAQIYDGGFIAAANDPVAYFNRITTEGSIAQFRKDGSTVGTIGVLGGIMDINGGSSLAVGAGDTGLLFTASSDDIRPFNVTTGSSRDAAIDLGTSSRRFKDLYLSGGVVFGATGGAVTSKTLDDYEEGTWVPTVSTASSHAVQTGIYTKIGNLVTIQCVIQFVQSGTVFGSVSGLPFTVAAVNYSGITFREWYSTGVTLSGNLTIGSQSTTGFWNYVNNSTATNGQTYGYGFSISYRT